MEVGDLIIFDCPWCQGTVQVKKSELNCKIFRHAIIKTTNQQINPHAPKHECEDLVAKGKVYGCAKPFKITGSVGSFKIEKCDYI